METSRGTEPRPEKVERGMKIAILMRAGASAKTIGLRLTDEQGDSFIEDVGGVEVVNEGDLDTHVLFGTRRGSRRPLTKRQAEVLQAYADGLDRAGTAARLGTTVDNVKTLTRAAKFAVDAETLAEAVAKVVAAGLVVAKPLPVYETLGRKPVHNASPRPKNRARFELADRDLSEREYVVLSLLADGFTLQQIADRLELKLEQVKHTVKNLQAKLRVRGRIQLVVAAVRRGIV